jgi:hypothetical protein
VTGIQLRGEDLSTFPVATPKGSAHFQCRCHSSSRSLPSDIHQPLQAKESNGHLTRLVDPVGELDNAIISLGLHTDAALDRFHLEDSLIPQLRVLVTTVRSSKWEAELRQSVWGLTFEQAFTLANALKADIAQRQVKVS